MRVRVMAPAALAVLLAAIVGACAGPGPGLTGNDTGGIIAYASMPPSAARDLASEHCAHYGKLARPTGADAQYGGYYSFSCRFDRRRHY